MSRRVLPVAVATAALVLVPSSAWAIPGHAPVQTMTGESYYAYTQVSLADGRRVSASLSEFRNGPGHPDWQAGLAISVMPQSPCWPTSLCDAGTGYAFLPL